MFKIKYRAKNRVLSLNFHNSNSHMEKFEDGSTVYINVKGKFHRTDGPAIIWAERKEDGDEWYCIDGEKYTFEEWQELCSK